MHRTLTAAAGLVLASAVLGALALGGHASAQEVQPADAVVARASHVVVPNSRSFRLSRERQGIVLERVKAHVKIVDRTAATTLEVSVRNPGSRDAEAVLVLPVPEGGAISQFDFQGNAPEPTARLLRREEARRIYDDIVSRARDPALLEFVGYNLIRSSVFPVPAGGTQKVRLTYEQVLGGSGNRVDYVLPRTESVDVTTPWEITIGVRGAQGVSTVFSPTHELATERLGEGHVAVSVRPEHAREPGPVRLSYLTASEGVSGSLFAYPDPKIGGGYFLFVAGLPSRADAVKKALKREVTLVIDRSGSMAGPKMDQVRAAALQVIEGLGDGESFNVIDYGTTVEMLSAKPLPRTRDNVLKARAYLDRLRPGGGTNIHDALVEALRQEPTEGALPLVLFLTDGLPTVGRTSEVRIRELVAEGNPHERRVFTFGVGTDVNVPLLDRTAEIARGRSTYVLPQEDVELAVADVFRQLYGPILSDASLTALDTRGADSTTRVRELIPGRLPDLFDGDQMVVLGQYHGEEPLRLRVDGRYLGVPETFDFTFSVKDATTRNDFVPRLWASRRIAYLVDQIRQAGADRPGVPRSGNATVMDDPRHRELVDEIVRLSTEFGVLSEYTAFFATEGTDLSNWGDLVAGCGLNLDRRAVRSRSGLGAVNQGFNVGKQKLQFAGNRRNEYLDENLNRVDVKGVLQIRDRAFFLRAGRWIDSRLVPSNDAREPQRTVTFGTPEYRALVDKLVESNRQALLALRGPKLLLIDGERVLVLDPEGC